MTGARHNPHSWHIPGPLNPMKYTIDMLKFQVLLQTGYTQNEVSGYANKGQRSARKIEHEPRDLNTTRHIIVYCRRKVPRSPSSKTAPMTIGRNKPYICRFKEDISGHSELIKRPGPGFLGRAQPRPDSDRCGRDAARGPPKTRELDPFPLSVNASNPGAPAVFIIYSNAPVSPGEQVIICTIALFPAHIKRQMQGPHPCRGCPSICRLRGTGNRPAPHCRT